MPIEKVLIVEDDPLMRTFLFEIFRRKEIEVVAVENGQKGFQQLEKRSFDLVISDMNLPIHSGIEVLKKAKEYACPLVILVTAYASVEQAVEAMRLGAFNYLIKPFTVETVNALFQKAEEHLALVEQNEYLKREISLTPKGKWNRIIAESNVMKKILADVSKIAKSNASVFISGESGTGKEVIAQAIHFQSERSAHPFIKVNCAAIPETLMESEFFGHEKGAFTGAINKRIGRFELADKGTLLLDEISEIPLSLQAKLLRAVQEQEFERIGSTKTLNVDVRFVSTSNRQMKETIEKKLFREDLYFRLNVVPIHLPPLRERTEDILPLAHFLLEKVCAENQRPLKKLSESGAKALLEYSWPGNIRELANVIERAVIMNAELTLDKEHLHLEEFSKPAQSSPKGTTLRELEKNLILETLSSLNNNKTKTAESLGISIRTLRNKLTEYSLG